MKNKMYQISTLQALALGYSRAVTRVGDLLLEGDTGLGTYEDVNGEMIVLDGRCYRAQKDGSVIEVDENAGVPFAAVARLHGEREFRLENMPNIQLIRTELTRRIEEHFGLNSMHVIRIDGLFEKVDARSEAPYRSHHVTLKTVLASNQTSFVFDNIKGSLVGVYYPDHMDGINMPGWHLHFISEDRTKGGHVFDVILKEGNVRLDKISRIEIQLPTDPAFDTYSLKTVSEDELNKVEKGD